MSRNVRSARAKRGGCERCKRGGEGRRHPARLMTLPITVSHRARRQLNVSDIHRRDKGGLADATGLGRRGVAGGLCFGLACRRACQTSPF
jgi:hypothetical protein